MAQFDAMPPNPALAIMNDRKANARNAGIPRGAMRKIREACAKDMEAFCGPQSTLFKGLRDADAPREERQQAGYDVLSCMLKNVELLAPGCRDLVLKANADGFDITSPASPVGLRPFGQWNRDARILKAEDEPNAGGQNPKEMIESADAQKQWRHRRHKHDHDHERHGHRPDRQHHHKRRHHHHPCHHHHGQPHRGHMERRDEDYSSEDRRRPDNPPRPSRDDDSSVDSSAYYVNNYRSDYAGRPHMISHRSGGYHPGENAMNPFWWLLILPFFCLGLYVTVKAGVATYRKRRQHVRADSSEYVPLRTEAVD